MKWLIVVPLALLLSQQLHAETANTKAPRNWLTLGFEAALADPQKGVGVAAVSIVGDLMPQLVEEVPTERAPKVIAELIAARHASDKVPDDSHFANSLATLALKVPKDQAGGVIDQLLTFLRTTQASHPSNTNSRSRALAAANREMADVGRNFAAEERSLATMQNDYNNFNGSLALLTIRESAVALRAALQNTKNMTGAFESLRQENEGNAHTGQTAEAYYEDALTVLGARIPHNVSHSVIDKLILLLAPSKVAPRDAAAAAIGGVGKVERAYVIDKLLPLLHDGDTKVRVIAARTLLNVGPGTGSARVIEGLTTLLNDSDLNVRLVAAEAVIAIDRTTARLSVTQRSGIGVETRPDYDSAVIKVVAVNPNGPAMQAGLNVGDLITQIDDEELTDGDLRFNDTVDLLSGSPNSQVRLKIERKGNVDPIEVSLRRDTLPASSAVLGDHARVAINTLLALAATNSSMRVRVAETFEQLAPILPGDMLDRVFDMLASFLNDREIDVRMAAIPAIAALGRRDRTDAAVDKLLPLFGEQRGLGTRAYAAVAALGSGEHAGRVIDKLRSLLPKQDGKAKHTTMYTLWRIAIRTRTDAVTAAVITILTHSLADREATVRVAAADVLGYLGQDGYLKDAGRAGEVVGKLTPLLSDSRSRALTIRSLGRLGSGDPDGQLIDLLLPFLSYPNENTTTGLALADLGTGDRAHIVIDKVLPHLHDSDPHAREGALDCLSHIRPGDGARRVMDQLLQLLRDNKDNDSYVRISTVEAVAAVGNFEPTTTAVDSLVSLLNDSSGLVKDNAVKGLASTPPERSDAVIGQLVPLLADKENFAASYNRDAFLTLGRLGPGGVSAALTAIGLIHQRGISEVDPLRAAAHLASGIDSRSETLLAWLGKPGHIPIDTTTQDPGRAHDVLALLLRHWSVLSANDSIRDESENVVMRIIYAACPSPVGESKPANFFSAVMVWLRYLPLTGGWRPCWSPEQRQTILQLLNRFKENHSAHEQALAAHLAYQRIAPVTNYMTVSVLGWTLLWASFLVAFPWSPTVQAMFFWNVRIRQALSLWIVPLLLLVFPLLRRRLLKPFHGDLIGAAQPNTFPRLGYFNRIRARLDGGPPVAVETLLAEAQGTIVIRGEAGLGKTSLLRSLAMNVRRPVAFLHARECAEGVDVAIAGMIRQIQEAGFVRSMVHTRAIMIIIDGLNEVSAGTREKIGSFAREMSKGDILIGTQPIEWLPPKGAKIIDLVPLERDEARDFLLTRPVADDTTQHCHGEAYVQAVDAFIHRALDEAPTSDDRHAAALMLSNPFDLSLAAELLADGTVPRATALIDAAFRLADEGSAGQPGYRILNGQAFPLVRFGHHAIAMRLENRNWFKEGEFPPETSCLLRWKLVVPRAVKSATGVTERLQFRHDRVWDFFIAAAFRAKPDVWALHLLDPRFRGAYLRIAETWDAEHATQVRDRLATVAAQTGDHTTSDEFIKRLEARRNF